MWPLARARPVKARADAHGSPPAAAPRPTPGRACNYSVHRLVDAVRAGTAGARGVPPHFTFPRPQKKHCPTPQPDACRRLHLGRPPLRLRPAVRGRSALRRVGGAAPRASPAGAARIVGICRGRSARRVSTWSWELGWAEVLRLHCAVPGGGGRALPAPPPRTRRHVLTPHATPPPPPLARPPYSLQDRRPSSPCPLWWSGRASCWRPCRLGCTDSGDGRGWGRARPTTLLPTTLLPALLPPSSNRRPPLPVHSPGPAFVQRAPGRCSRVPRPGGRGGARAPRRGVSRVMGMFWLVCGLQDGAGLLVEGEGESASV